MAARKAASTKKAPAQKKAPAKKKAPAQKKAPFARVWAVVLEVPRGRVITYGRVSQLIDRRLTPVGVGWAIRAAGEDQIPWHRVVNGHGGISTDGEHPGLQRAMLESEGVRFRADGTIDLTVYGWPNADAARAPKSKSSKRSKPR